MGLYERITEIIEANNDKINAIRKQNDLLDAMAFQVGEKGEDALSEEQVVLLRNLGIVIVRKNGKYMMYEELKAY